MITFCLRRLLVVISLLGAVATTGWAQTYPTKVVRVLVSFSPGSGSDTVGRIMAAGLTEVFGQQVIVENRAGAAGNIGVDMVAKATPDGYLLLLMIMGHAANVSLYSKLPYDLFRDFAPITQIATSPQVLVVHPALPVKSTQDLVKLAKAKPGMLNYSSAGAGTSTFLAAELFKASAGIDMMHVAYRGGGEALTAVMSGEVSVYFAPFATALPQIRQGRLRPLAVTSAKRLSLLPDYPTVAESGYPSYEFGNWYGMLAPAKTPKDIIMTVNRAAISALNSQTVSKRLAELGYITVGDQPDEFGVYIRSEVEKLGKLIRKLGLKAD